MQTDGIVLLVGATPDLQLAPLRACRKRDRNAFISSFVVPVATPGELHTLVKTVHRALLHTMAERDVKAQLKFRCQRDRRWATRASMRYLSVSCFPTS
jgi:hypothetical protein